MPEPLTPPRPAPPPPASPHPIPLVLLHGWGLGPAVWTALDPGPAAGQPERLALPGYARRPDDGAGFDACAEALAGQLPPRALVCAWSLGALLALEAARRRPGHLAGLLLTGATPCFVQAPGWPCAQAPEVLQGFAQAVAEDRALALQRFAALVHQGDDRARALTRASQQALRDGTDPLPSADTLARGLRWLRDTDLRPALPQIDLPCTVLHGTQDGLAPLAAGQALAAALPHGRFEPMPGAAHAPHLHDPAAFLAQLRRFRDELAAA